MDGKCHCEPGEHIEPMSLRAYARHRGVSGPAVVAARAKGRLVECFKDGSGAVTPQIQNAVLADQEWERKTDLSRAPVAVRLRAAAAPGTGEDDVPDLADASAREKHWRAKLAELKFKEAAGEVVPAAGVRAELEGVFRSCRTRLLGIPSRARQLLPGLSVADVGVLEGLVREALEELASGAKGEQG